MQINLIDKVNFIFHSNQIEEITIPIINYGAWENSTYPEISGHAQAFDYMLEYCNEPLTESHILKMHSLLTKGLVDDKYRGRYRDCAVFIGGSEGVLPILIKPEMEKFILFCDRPMIEKQCWNAHDEFEIIHPFIDGNGRTGRLILNWLRFKNELPLFTIDYNSMRWRYYQKIQEYRLEKIVKQSKEDWEKERKEIDGNRK